MSNQVLVTQIQPDDDGPVYGRVSNPADFMKSQEYAHKHIENIVRDFLVGGCGDRPQVAGFEYTLIGGLSIRIIAPGQIANLEGHSYDFGAAFADLPLAAADPNNPRVDLLYAKIELVEAESELRPFIRLRTQQELEAGVAPYPPEQFNQPTELQFRALILAKTGPPAAQPQSPAFASDEIPLYEVQVRAGASSLSNSDVVDVRDRVRSLRCAWALIDLLKAQLDQLLKADHEHPARKIYIEGKGPYAGKKVQDFIDDQSLRTGDTFYDPLIYPELLTPELAPIHSDAGTLVSTGDLDVGIPVAYFTKDRKIVFSNATYVITPDKFPDGFNAHYVNKDVAAGANTNTNQFNFSLASINSVVSDGQGEMVLKNFAMASPKVRNVVGGRMVAARNGQLLEVLGGAYNQGDSSWHTVDTVAGTVTQRAFNTDIPTNSIIFAAPMGNGTHILIAERAGSLGSDGRGALRWYKVNAVTGQSIRFASAPGTTGAPALPVSNSQQEAAVVGDLIQTNVIFLIVSAPAAGFQVQYWIYHVDTNNFQQINPDGQGPSFYNVIGQTYLRDIDCCLFQQGKAVIVEAWSSVKTFVFDYSTLSFTRLQIPQPTSDKPDSLPSGRDRLSGPSIANIGGRILLASAFSSIWELIPGTPGQWRIVDTSLENATGTRGWAGLVGLLADGLPKGRGYLIGGVIAQPTTPKADIWGFEDAGIVETICDGQTALTIGGGATQASFLVPAYTIPFAVGRLLVSLRGHAQPGQIRLSYSFDGLNFQEVTRDEVTTILNSDNPAIRTLKITLIGVGSQKPCLIGITERFEQAGIASPGFQQTFVQYNVVTAGVRGLYIDRFGVITIEADIKETTADKALLHIVTPTGPSTAPSVKDIIQQRLVQRLFTGTHSGSNPIIINRLPRRPRFIQAWRFVAGAAQDLANPTIEFNNSITVGGLSITNTFRLEVQA